MKLKRKNTYNWKFYCKLIIGILPILSSIIFFIGQSSDLFHHQKAYWDFLVGDCLQKYKPGFYEEVTNWTPKQNWIYLFPRNILVFTTLMNWIAASWMINSACNNCQEAQGKFDNYKMGLILLHGIFWIALLYNASLLVTGAVSKMKWYNYVSWTGEHSLPQIGMIVYFWFFYPKLEKIQGKKQHSIYFVLTLSTVFVYQLFFLFLGLILNATKSFMIFGEMSASGYFPYEFLDITKANQAPVLSFLTPQTQLIGVFGVFILEGLIWYLLSNFFNNQKIKTRDREKQKIKPIKV